MEEYILQDLRIYLHEFLLKAHNCSDPWKIFQPILLSSLQESELEQNLLFPILLFNVQVSTPILMFLTPSTLERIQTDPFLYG